MEIILFSLILPLLLDSILEANCIAGNIGENYIICLCMYRCILNGDIGMHFVGVFAIKTYADWNKTAKFVKV